MKIRVEKEEDLKKFYRKLPLYRSIFYYQTAPDFKMLLYVLVVALAIFGIGLKTFNKLEKGFAEEL